MILFVLRVFAVRPLCNFLRELYCCCMGVAVLLDARTILIATTFKVSPLPGRAGWCEDTSDDSVHASENSVVAGVAASPLRELDVAVAAARCGENNCNGHLLEFKNSLLAAESCYSLYRLNSLNSLICHPSMHAPSLTSEMCVESVGVVGVERFGEGDVEVARWLGIARVDGSMHDVIRCVSARFNSRIRGHSECHGSSCGQFGSSPNSRVVRGPGLRGGTKEQVRQGAGEKLAFAQQLSGRVRVGTWAGGKNSLNLRISQEKEIMTRCAGATVPSLIPFVTLVLPGPGSDIRMKMEWKVLSKTRKSGVWSFQTAGSLWESGVWPMLMGAVDWVRKGSYHTAWAFPCGSLCSCSYAYGRGPAVGPHTGQRCWPLLAGVRRAIAPLMKPWCAEGEVRTAANLNLYRGCTRALVGTVVMSRCLGDAQSSSCL